MHYSYSEFAEGKSANRCRSIKDLADIFELEATTAVLWPLGDQERQIHSIMATWSLIMSFKRNGCMQEWMNV